MEGKKETKPLLHTYVSHLKLGESQVLWPKSAPHNHSSHPGQRAPRNWKLNYSQSSWAGRKHHLALMHKRVYGAVSEHRQAHRGGKSPKTSPEQSKVLVTTSSATAALIAAAYRRTWVHFAHSWWHQFYHNKIRTKEMWFSYQASCTQSTWTLQPLLCLQEEPWKWFPQAEANSFLPVWTSSGDVGGVRVTEDMAGSLVEAGTWWTPRQAVEQWGAPTELGAGMSVWGTSTKHAGYTILTPAAKRAMPS